jgi:NADPH:quinone reductase
MKSLVLPSYNKNIIRAMLGLKVQESELPVPNSNDVLIKIHASPVNPSDIAFMQGTYNIVKTLPAIPGFEASGEVIDAGIEARSYIGKKVSCFVQDDLGGTWSDYVKANVNDVIVLKDDMNMDQAACFTVNPFTAYGLFDIVLLRESKAIIQNAAGSQVAAFIRKMAQINYTKVINIVRKQETADKLLSDGIKYVLVDIDEDFVEKLTELSLKLNPTVAFDAVGGTLAGYMFNSLDNDSELVVYGGLSGKPISGINVMDVIFKNKIISGFNLIDWKSEIGVDEFMKISEVLQNKFIDGTYSTSVIGYSSLDDIVKGLKGYISDMSNGKLLVKP